MNIILGGTGHIGSTLSLELIKNNIPVTITTRNPEKAAILKSKGAKIAEVDIYDTASLHKIFLTGERLFLLNPPALPFTDTVKEEQKTLYSIIKALKGSNIKKVVAASTYGARPGTGQGDLNVLYEMEQELRKMNISVNLIRSAYYMSNFDGYLHGVKSEGVLPSFYPADFALPMVAPQDIGKFAAQVMMIPEKHLSAQLYHFEGPQLYTPNDVADAFSKALGKLVQVAVIPKEKWEETFRSSGFSDEAAASYAAMTMATLEDDHTKLTGQIRGQTTIEDYVRGLVAPSQQHKSSGLPLSSDSDHT